MAASDATVATHIHAPWPKGVEMQVAQLPQHTYIMIVIITSLVTAIIFLFTQRCRRRNCFNTEIDG